MCESCEQTDSCRGGEVIDGGADTFVCDYAVVARTPCSEPCGGGQQVSLELLMSSETQKGFVVLTLTWHDLKERF